MEMIVEKVDDEIKKPSESESSAIDNGDDDEEDEDEDDEEDDESNSFGDKNDNYQLEGVYDPAKYESLNVPDEVRNSFSFINYYTPQMIDINPRLKPFIPDYIPAVGDVDAFIKIPYPDKRENLLGLTVLDEPSVQQSDSALLRLKLKTMNKTVNTDSNVDNLEESTNSNTKNEDLIMKCSGSFKEIDNWIENVRVIHETMARPDSVTLMHQHQRFDIEQLMQEWPEEIETALNVHQLPGPDLDCSLEEYVSILCAFLDIPVQQNNKISSLYLMFSLLNEFQSSQHFKKYDH